MNRNAAIGVVLVGVLLAALSVGIATYMSKGTIDESAEAMRGEVAATSDELGAKIDAVAENALPKKNGEAQALASVDTLWSKGRLTVTDPTGTGTPVFEVDPTASRVVIDAGAIEFGDVDAGALTSTGDVIGAGFATKSGGWAVDDGGTQRSDGDLTVGGDTELGGILKVNGGELRVGDGFVYEAGAKKLSVIGTIVASTFDSGNSATEYVSDVIFHKSVSAKSGAWRVEQDGTAKFAGTKVASLTSGAINGTAVTAESLNVSGLAATKDLTASGSVTGANVIAIGTLKTQGDTFTVAAATGDTTIGGTLTVAGMLTASDIDASGNVDVDTLSFNGVAFDPGKGSDSGKDIVARDITAHRTLKTNGDLFTVDANTGDTVVGGSLSATGLITASDIDASGNVDVDTLSFNGVVFDPGTGNVTSKDIVGRDITAYRTLKTNGDRFTVDAATGNTVIAGTLDVGAITATSLTATGDISADNISASGDLTVTGNISAANLPGIASGTVVADPGPNVVPVAGMPAGATVVVTPQGPSTGYFVPVVAAGSFQLVITDPASVPFSWIAVW